MSTFIDTKFNSYEEKLSHYKKLVQENAAKIKGPTVTWSHDISNVSLYRTVFPNSKIIVITQESPHEKLVVTFMHVIKNLIDDNVVTPLTPKEFAQIRQVWKQSVCTIPLLQSLPENKINIIFSDPKYETILKYAYFECMLYFYQLNYIVRNSDKQSYSELVMFGLSNKIYEIYDNYNLDTCIKLPYQYLIDDNVSLLLDTVSTALSKELTDSEKIFVMNNFNKYRNKQDLTMVINPITYYEQLKYKAYKMLYTDLS
jgi:hypothetical protein